MSAKRIDVSGPIEVDHGYYELRVNWDGATLLEMTGDELERFKAAIAQLESLSAGAETATIPWCNRGPNVSERRGH